MFPVPAPLGMVIVVPLGVRVAVVAAILSIADCPVAPCGLVAGKLVWFAIAVKPPTSSIRSITVSYTHLTLPTTSRV